MSMTSYLLSKGIGMPSKVRLGSKAILAILFITRIGCSHDPIVKKQKFI